MTSVDIICNSIHNLVKSIGEQAWTSFDGNCELLNQARTLHQHLRQLDAVVSDLQPYIGGVRVWGSLREIEAALASLLQVLLEVSGKGSLVQYVQADQTLAHFAAAAARLAAALAGLEEDSRRQANAHQSGSGRPGGAHGSSSGGGGAAVAGPAVNGRSLSEYTWAELHLVREQLQGAQFELPAAHRANLQCFRKACDGLGAHFRALMLSYGEMMEHMQQEALLSKEFFIAVIAELQAEVERQQQQQYQQHQHHHHHHHELSLLALQSYGGPPSGRALPGESVHPHLHQGQPLQPSAAATTEQHQLRLLMDVVRASHLNDDASAPLDFLCPLTHQLMKDPVLLHETGHSYDRQALEEWWATGHRFCPRTGLHLRRLNFSPNHNLRAAIERWSLHSDMHLSFKPVLDTLVSQQRHQLQQHRMAAVPRREDQVTEQGREQGGWAGKAADGSLPPQVSPAAPPGCSGDAGQDRCAMTGSSGPASRDAPGDGHWEQQRASDAGRAGCGGYSEAASEGTGRCTTSIDTSQHSSNEELELSRFTSWAGRSSDVGASEFMELGCAGTVGPAGAEICCSKTKGPEGGLASCTCAQAVQLDGVLAHGCRVRAQCFPGRVADVVRAGRPHEGKGT